MSTPESPRDEIASALPCGSRCYPATRERGQHSRGCLANRLLTADALLASPVLADLQARLDAIAAYAGHPGNWGASDHRGQLIHDLATGAIDPGSRDWADTNLPARGEES